MARLRDYHYYVAVLPLLCSTIWKQDIEKSGIHVVGIQMVTVFETPLNIFGGHKKVVHRGRLSELLIDVEQ